MESGIQLCIAELLQQWVHTLTGVHITYIPGTESDSNPHSRAADRVNIDNSAFWVVNGRKAPKIAITLPGLRLGSPSSSARRRLLGLLYASRAAARRTLSKDTLQAQKRQKLTTASTPHTIDSRVLTSAIVLPGVGQSCEQGQHGERRRGDGGLLFVGRDGSCLLYTSPSPRDRTRSRMPSSA